MDAFETVTDTQLATLPPVMAKVAGMARDGMSVARICAELGVYPSTVERTLARARAKLSEPDRLRPHGYQSGKMKDLDARTVTCGRCGLRWHSANNCDLRLENYMRSNDDGTAYEVRR